MKLGLAMFPTHDAIRPAELGRVAEENGFESLFFPEHTHIPASRRRFSLRRERVEAMKAIWTQDEAEYHGEHVDFDPIWSWPKPMQEPHPPVLIGGNGEKVIDRVVAFGDEWMPNLGLTDPGE